MAYLRIEVRISIKAVEVSFLVWIFEREVDAQ